MKPASIMENTKQCEAVNLIAGASAIRYSTFNLFMQGRGAKKGLKRKYREILEKYLGHHRVILPPTAPMTVDGQDIIEGVNDANNE
mmetsp:Transcript_26259/g.65662  ORF Transcript_26259/g.65662 Transcript_26259/m.65662 type:complete len:86 (+) Transcript_26259:127-384(+)